MLRPSTTVTGRTAIKGISGLPQWLSRTCTRPLRSHPPLRSVQQRRFRTQFRCLQRWSHPRNYFAPVSGSLERRPFHSTAHQVHPSDVIFQAGSRLQCLQMGFSSLHWPNLLLWSVSSSHFLVDHPEAIQEGHLRPLLLWLWSRLRTNRRRRRGCGTAS